MHFLYSIGLAVWLLAGAPWWLVQMIRHGKHRAGLGERFGRVPARLRGDGASRACIWVHAVSVGEVLAISGVVQQLRRRFPEKRIVVSTTTATGQKLARERFGEEDVFYFPLDLVFAIRPYLRVLRPELVVIAETEFWPNFLRLAKASGARLAVVNARISDRSFPRYRLLRGVLRGVLAAVDCFLAQSHEDARRLREIGAPPERVRVSGNLKFDVSLPPEKPIVADLRAAIRQQGVAPVWVCGSTTEGEEELLLRVFAGCPHGLLILAPRHPERFAAVARLAADFPVRMYRRSELQPSFPWDRSVLILDSIGELASIYGLADVAFVGGSLVPRGGHNILEPALHGVPIMVGPHTENFRDIVARFRDAGALLEAASEQELQTAFQRGVQEKSALGAKVRAVAEANTGATARTMEALAALLQAEVRLS